MRLPPRFLLGLVTGAAIVACVGWIGHTVEEQKRDLAFRGRALRDLGLVQRQLRGAEAELQALEIYYRASDLVRPDEFELFALPLLDHPGGPLALFHARSDPATGTVSIDLLVGDTGERAWLTDRVASRRPHDTTGSDAPDRACATFAPPGLASGSDEVALVLDLPPADPDVHESVGALVSMARVVDAALGPLGDAWTSVSIVRPQAPISTAGTATLLARRGEPVPNASRRERLPAEFGDIELELVAQPTVDFAAANRSWFAEGLALLTAALLSLGAVWKRAQRQRLQYDTQLDALRSALPLPWAQFGPDLELLHWNPPFAALLALHEEHPDSWQDGFDAQGLARLQDAWQRALDTGETRQEECWWNTATGGRRRLLAVSRPSASGSAILGLQVVLIDSTEAYELEQQLRRAQKLEAVGQLAGGIAHDFNNVLTAILGYASMVLDSLEEDTLVRDDMLQIQAACRRAASLTGRLLAMTRDRAGEFVPVDLTALVRETCSLAAPSLGMTIDLVLELPGDLPRVTADPGQVEQVILNLLFNARDAMSAGGIITVTAEHQHFAADSGSPVVRPVPGEHVVLSVSDTGSGIAPELVERIFEPLFTTKEHGRGTGLGLSMSRTVIEGHGGGLWLASEPGAGSTLRISFPTTPLVPERTRPQVPPRGEESILVVEDQDVVRKLTVRLLTGLGYRVQAADGPQRAHELVREARFDLFVLDVLLPTTNGIVLAQELALVSPGTPVLFVSGYSADVLADLEELREGEPPIDLLPKPFTREALAERVREALDRAAVRSRQPS